jgi:four helix bundle protein
MQSYRDLKVWQLGVEISLEVYRATNSFPQFELYGVTSQMRRAAVSIASNIAEGHTRGATKDLIRFLGISRGSVAELETQLLISMRLGYLEPRLHDKLVSMLDEESRMISGLRRSLTARLKRES